MEMDRILRSFENNGFEAVYFETAAEAADNICAGIQNKTVGIGGCITAKEMGLYEKLAGNNEVFWHWITPGPETLDKASRAEVYITSANGLSETGEIVNIDGTGNRVASMLYGHDTVYFVCGVNKLEADLDAAIKRARNVASPLNARRIGTKTPCTVGELKCHDCSSPGRICKGLVVLWKKPNAIKNAKVILIGEKLGY